MILVRNGITFLKRPDLSCMEKKLIESVYIEVRAKNGKSYIIGSLYRAPNSEGSGRMQHIGKTAQLTETGKSKSELILGMDQNLDLLKSNIHTPRKFLDLVLD